MMLRALKNLATTFWQARTSSAEACSSSATGYSIPRDDFSAEVSTPPGTTPLVVAPSTPTDSKVYKYPADILEPLKAEWYEWHRREADIPQLPDDDHLRRLLEVAYHASFTADEQRRTRFRLVLCDEEQASGPLRLLLPRELVPHEIMRLAPAAGATESMLAVAVVDGTLKIWGLCDSAFMQLVVSARGPGTIHVGRNNLVFLALEAGHFSDAYSRPGVFQAVIESLSSANGALWENIDWPGGSWSPQVTVFPGLVYDALASIQSAGHGGTVLIVPDDDMTSRPWARVLHVKYECNDNSIWPKLQTTVLQYDSKVLGDLGQNSQSEGAEGDVRALLSRIAGLAAVDGAVLVTDRLRLLGFGVEVLAPPTVASIYLPDGATRDVTAYGTRHRSAFRFCGAYPRGTAIVCSQDGGIKCVRNQDGRVTLWQ